MKKSRVLTGGSGQGKNNSVEFHENQIKTQDKRRGSLDARRRQKSPFDPNAR